MDEEENCKIPFYDVMKIIRWYAYVCYGKLSWCIE